MTFTTPPTPPTTNDPANFPTRADAFLSWLATFAAELDTNFPSILSAIEAANVAAANATAYATSTTSLAVSTTATTRSLTFAETGRTFQVGQYVNLAVTASAAVNYMYGRISAVNNAAKTMTIAVDGGAGSGTFAAWTISLGAPFGRPAATASNIRAGTSSAVDITPQAFFQAMAFQTLTDAATIAWDMAGGPNAAVTLGASRTVGLPTSLQDGLPVALAITQGTGGNFTLTWNSVFDFGAVGAPTLSTAAGKTDFVFGVYRSATGKIHATFWKSA